MSKVKLVEVAVKKGNEVLVGTKVEIKETSVPGKDKVLGLFFDGEEVGYVIASKRHASQLNLESEEELYKEISDENAKKGFTGIVSDSLPSNRYVIEVDMKQFKKTHAPAPSGTSLKLELKVSGSVREYQAKSAVIKAFKAGRTVYVDLKKGESSDNGIEITFPEMLEDRKGNPAKAGVIRTDSNEELTQLKEILDAGVSLKGAVVSSEDSSYVIEVKVDNEITTAIESGAPIPDVENIKERLVSEGITSDVIVDDVVSYLQKNGVPVSTIMKVLNSYKKYDEDAAAYIPKKPSTEFVDEGRFVNRSVSYVLAGPTNPVRFTGEAGTGKNLLITTLAWIFQRPLFEKAVNAEIDKFDLLGSKTTDIKLDDKGNQQTSIVFEAETFIKAMEVGGFCNLDEINTGNPGVLTLIHPVIDGRSYIDVPGYGRVRADENFGIFSTMNVGYAGTQQLNKATRDRFTTLVFEPNKSIRSILESHSDTRDASVQNMEIADKLYRGMHQMVEDQELDDDCLTVRGFIKAVKFSELLGIREALIDNVANNIDEPEYRQQVIDYIDTVC